VEIIKSGLVRTTGELIVWTPPTGQNNTVTEFSTHKWHILR